MPNELHRAALAPLVGRKLVAIVHGEGRASAPASSVFLFFDDGHCMELFSASEPVQLAKNLREWTPDEVVEMLRKGGMEVFEVRA